MDCARGRISAVHHIGSCNACPSNETSFSPFIECHACEPEQPAAVGVGGTCSEYIQRSVKPIQRSLKLRQQLKRRSDGLLVIHRPAPAVACDESAFNDGLLVIAVLSACAANDTFSPFSSSCTQCGAGTNLGSDSNFTGNLSLLGMLGHFREIACDYSDDLRAV